MRNATSTPTALRAWQAAVKLGVRPLVRRAARQALQGRLLDPRDPRRGRWLRPDVQACLAGTWRRVDGLLPAARLEELPTWGNRLNVFLAVVTTAAYQEILEWGASREYAATLVADLGWKIYAWMLAASATPARILTRSPRRRLEWTLKLLMRFPFGAPGKPGYEVRAWSEGERFFTHWTHCPPQAFVRALVEAGEDRGELEAFYRSWCLYDWSGADLLAGDGERGHYRRPHTMSRGDAVCDMCWWARRAGEGAHGPAGEPSER
jgi:hypothetical protein